MWCIFSSVSLILVARCLRRPSPLACTVFHAATFAVNAGKSMAELLVSHINTECEAGKYHFSSLRCHPNGNRTQSTSFGGASINYAIYLVGCIVRHKTNFQTWSLSYEKFQDWHCLKISAVVGNNAKALAFVK